MRPSRRGTASTAMSTRRRYGGLLTYMTRRAPHQVAVVGAGFSGLCMAIHLQRAGMRDFVVFDKGSDIGGVWRDNVYPGCGCDVPSHLYSYSFARYADWTRAYPKQQEILDYLHRCV